MFIQPPASCFRIPSTMSINDTHLQTSHHDNIIQFSKHLYLTSSIPVLDSIRISDMATSFNKKLCFVSWD
uniref:Uncharacterized protein n=1 Tax=Rhizophora mucronata TaxID=61149 RepID=A0A2P2Q718_RHIMU